MSKILHTCLTRYETAKLSIHDIRLENAVWSPETSRFHPDAREHSHVSKNGQMLTNLFQLGTALVASQDGTVLAAVSARDASRAAASVALREIRAGRTPAHNWSVSMRNKSGESHSETVFFGFDRPDRTVSQDDTADGELSHIEMSLDEMAMFNSFGIDDSDMDGWQERNWESHIEPLNA